MNPNTPLTPAEVSAARDSLRVNVQRREFRLDNPRSAKTGTAEKWQPGNIKFIYNVPRPGAGTIRISLDQQATAANAPNSFTLVPGASRVFPAQHVVIENEAQIGKIAEIEVSPNVNLSNSGDTTILSGAAAGALSTINPAFFGEPYANDLAEYYALDWLRFGSIDKKHNSGINGDWLDTGGGPSAGYFHQGEFAIIHPAAIKRGDVMKISCYVFNGGETPAKDNSFSIQDGVIYISENGPTTIRAIHTNFPHGGYRDSLGIFVFPWIFYNPDYFYVMEFYGASLVNGALSGKSFRARHTVESVSPPE